MHTTVRWQRSFGGTSGVKPGSCNFYLFFSAWNSRSVSLSKVVIVTMSSRMGISQYTEQLTPRSYVLYTLGGETTYLLPSPLPPSVVVV